MKNTPLRFCLFGIGFGFLFPVIAVLFDSINNGNAFSFEIIWQRHLQNPVLFVVDLAPVVLGIAGILIGKRQYKLEKNNLDSRIDLVRFFQLSPDMLCIANGDGFFIEINGAFTKVLGYSKEELLSKPYVEFVHPDDRNATMTATGDLAGGNPVYLFENRYITKDGDTKWLSWQAIPLENGTRVYAIARDVSETKLSAEKTENERLLFRGILESANFSIIATDPNGTIRFFNSTAEQLLGYSESEMVGKQTPDILHHKNEIIQRATELSQELNMKIEPGFDTFVIKSRITKKPDEHSWTYIKKNGSSFPVLLSVTTLFDETGNVNGYLGIAKDISSLVETENKLKESERLLGEFLESLPIGIFIVKNDGVPFYANKRSFELLGKGIIPDSTTEALSEIYSVYKGETDVLYPTIELPVVKALSGTKNYAEDLVINRDGQKLPLEVWASPVTNIQGEVIYAIAAFNEIKDRKERESSLQILSLVVNQTSSGVMITDSERQIEWINDAFSIITGYSLEEIKGKKPGRFLQGPGTSEKTIDSIRQGIIKGENISVEILNYNKSGKPFWIHLNISPIRDPKTNEIKGYFSIEDDITEKKKNEIRIKLLLEIGSTIFKAKNLREALKLSIETILQNTSWEYGEFWFPNDKEGELYFSGAWHSLIPTGEKFAESSALLSIPFGKGFPGEVWKLKKEIRIKTQNISDLNSRTRKGEKQDAGFKSSFGFPVMNGEKVIMIGIFHSSRDVLAEDELSETFEAIISELSLLVQRFQTEKSLENYAQKLEKTNKELDQFAYIVSHDLKAPLRAMYLLSEWTAEDVKAGKMDTMDENLKTIQQRARRMESLIEGILEYSKAGKQNLINEEFDCDELIVQAFDSLSSDKKTTLIFQPGVGKITGKRTLLFQVFSNLISNAIKYQDKEFGKIEITYSQKRKFVEFRIKDNGPGIESIYHQKIFVMFQRLNEDETIEGTGIGLSLVKKIVEGEGGNIWVESEKNKGATFCFTWPRILRS